MTRQAVVVSFSLGTMFLLLACAMMVAGAMIAQSQREPGPIVMPPRIGPANSVLKEAIDEWKYGPVDRAKQAEVKDGLLDRLRARRQSRLCPPMQASPMQTSPVQTYASITNLSTMRNGPTEVRIVCPPRVVSGENAPAVSLPEYPAVSLDALLYLNPSDCPSCDRGAELKTGVFVCSHCGKACVGDEWHTDWQPDGTPLTFLCKECYGKLTPSQRQSVLNRYLKQQASHPLRGLAPEVSR
jgi:hypothetical protein